MLDTLGSLRVQKLLEGEIILNLLSDLDGTIHSQPFSFWDVNCRITTCLSPKRLLQEAE